ncbi:MAG: patatin-like phospholipase family protein [Deltaproteobacteria bacterium]|jgi:NTE family protein|nr:patatin-like phospholipase family protein [Deltaproteobacteria bacterium]
MKNRSDKNYNLVLCGGGALGAFQAGVIKAFSEIGVSIGCVSGASIGALNAAVVASSSTLKHAANTLESIWMSLAEKSPDASSAVLQTGLLSKNNIKRIICNFCDNSAFDKGISFYVSLYPKESSITRFVELITTSFTDEDTPESDYLLIQELAPEDRIKAIVASACLPWFYGSEKINGKIYTDGGQGRFHSRKGNTPAEPVIKNNRESTTIVAHLESDSPWNRFDYTDSTIIEIRPIPPLSKDFTDIFDFTKNKILSYMSQGYDNTMKTMTKIADFMNSLNYLDSVFSKQIEISKELNSSSLKVENAMQKIKNLKRT